MMFHCDRLSCNMEEAACVIRRRNSLTAWKPGQNKAGSHDEGCRVCPQGKEIGSRVTPENVKAYQFGLAAARRNSAASENQAGGRHKPGETYLFPTEKQATEFADSNFKPEKTKICQRAGCGHAGKAQPESCFYKNKASKDGLSTYCKACTVKSISESRNRQKSANPPPEQPKKKDETVTKEEKIMKRCNTCGTEKDISDFPLSNTSKDGHMHICRTCFMSRQESGLHRRKSVSVLHLSFDGHDELLAALSKCAKEEFRTIQQQALAIIQRAVAGK